MSYVRKRLGLPHCGDHLVIEGVGGRLVVKGAGARFGFLGARLGFFSRLPAGWAAVAADGCVQILAGFWGTLPAGSLELHTAAENIPSTRQHEKRRCAMRAPRPRKDTDFGHRSLPRAAPGSNHGPSRNTFKAGPL